MTRQTVWFSLLATATFFILLLLGLTGTVFASGSIYYAYYGYDSNNCGTSAPCYSYSKAYNRACVVSADIQDIVYIYSIHDGYAGFCDKTGGGGTEPRPRESGIPRPSLQSLLEPLAMWFVVGLVIGGAQAAMLRRRQT